MTSAIEMTYTVIYGTLNEISVAGSEPVLTHWRMWQVAVGGSSKLSSRPRGMTLCVCLCVITPQFLQLVFFLSSLRSALQMAKDIATVSHSSWSSLGGRFSTVFLFVCLFCPLTPFSMTFCPDAS